VNFDDETLGSANTQVMPHSHSLTARVSTAWTISRPLGFRVGAGVCAAGGGTTHNAAVAAAAAYLISHPL